MISIGPGVPRVLPDRLAVLLDLFVEASANMAQRQHTSPHERTGNIVTFVFTCPFTGLRVQGWVSDDASGPRSETYGPVSCHACGGLHLVDPRSGRVLGRPDV
jgi:hypothetical protein